MPVASGVIDGGPEIERRFGLDLLEYVPELLLSVQGLGLGLAQGFFRLRALGSCLGSGFLSFAGSGLRAGQHG
eukprot:1560794-Rhodomonas_salina.1